MHVNDIAYEMNFILIIIVYYAYNKFLHVSREKGTYLNIKMKT